MVMPVLSEIALFLTTADQMQEVLDLAANHEFEGKANFIQELSTVQASRERQAEIKKRQAFQALNEKGCRIETQLAGLKLSNKCVISNLLHM
ncbi:hypothetical protein Pelo_19955 [Pelomyxa schiedti]|nr:hypothetical protein Pelo_19955 [Pelomyxa schiedti]